MPIITLSRQYGSGGSEVAELTAKTLGWELLDNEVVDAVAARLGLSIEEVKAREERAPSLVERLSSALAMGWGVLAEVTDREIFVAKLHDFIGYLVPKYQSEMKSYLTIGIGCTGGKHRSVAIAQRIAEGLTDDGYRVEIVHRDSLR